MIPFPSLFDALQWWMRTVRDFPVSVLIDTPEFTKTAPYGRRTIRRGPGGWGIWHV